MGLRWPVPSMRPRAPCKLKLLSKMTSTRGPHTKVQVLHLLRWVTHTHKHPKKNCDTKRPSHTHKLCYDCHPAIAMPGLWRYHQICAFAVRILVPSDRKYPGCSAALRGACSFSMFFISFLPVVSRKAL